MEEQIQEHMESPHFNDQGHQLELQVYWTTFPHFKYEPPSFVSLEIGTNSKTLATSFMVKLVAMTKPVSLLRGGTSLEIIPLHV